MREIYVFPIMFNDKDVNVGFGQIATFSQMPPEIEGARILGGLDDDDEPTGDYWFGDIVELVTSKGSRISIPSENVAWIKTPEDPNDIPDPISDDEDLS